MIITIVYILISFILFYVALTGFKAANLGIEAKKINKFEKNKKKLNKKNVLKELESYRAEREVKSDGGTIKGDQPKMSNEPDGSIGTKSPIGS